MNPAAYHKVDIDGTQLFYREAGYSFNPTILLLHGFSSSSHMFRDLIPLLSDRYHLVAPDLPGFGLSELKPKDAFDYSSKNLAKIVGRFTELIGLDLYSLYVFDYGAIVGFQLAMTRPERIQAIISQNGNAYDEGLTKRWDPINDYCHHPTPENRQSLLSLLTPAAFQLLYEHGASNPALVSPDGIGLDILYSQRPGFQEVQLNILRDFANSPTLYPRFQSYFKTARPRLLAIWGENDPYFSSAGALAFKRDIPDAEVSLLGTGRFALETHPREIAAAISHFLG